MMLLKVIDGLFVGTRYGVWLLGVLGIIGSVILAVANVGAGISAMLVCVGALLLSIAVALLLMPQNLTKNRLEGRNPYLIGTIALIAAMIVVGGVYFTNGGFPDLNLIFT